MIKSLTIKQHYDACIEAWNWMAENNKCKSLAPVVLKYNPKFSCFTCEAYWSNYCINCPLNILDYTASCKHVYPYADYYNAICKYELPENLKEISIEIAQIFIDAYDKL